jgi:hypothetical protein
LTSTASQLNSPRSIAVDLNGNVLICDTNNHIIRRVNINTNTIVVIAGIPQQRYR